ncbi:Major Facilitator Superfamily protein [Actinomadura madurae]|uniref:Major Facilitator Superfamily protein n=1 Tax=Actinomadura madurae TaxID=1993 RepID=A0A1I5JZ89_9ACTN|nr:MFS transporter [Actinomadura madurae]SFO77711.1 Major Facilitator Superfamily protein [Actinomadura madurae]
MTSSSYAAVLRTPHASRTFALAFLGRLSYGTVFLSLTLALTASTGSYAQAGALVALEGLTVSVLSPVRAALIDRHGPRRALPPMTAAYALVLTAFAALTWRPGAPLALLAVLAMAAGVTAPPVGVVMRTLWSGLLPAGPLLRRAYSLDTVSEELVFVAGPLLAGLLAAAAAPSLGILVSAVLIAAGTAGMVTSPAAGPRPAPRPVTPRRGPRTRIFPAAPAVAAAATGVVLGSTGLLAIAFTERHHQPGAVAWVEAAVAAGSTIGGLGYGALGLPAPGRARLAVLLVPLGLAPAAAGLAPSTAALAALACAAGLFVGPALTTAYLLADEAAPPGARTRAMAWVNTALNLGAAGGTAATGAALDTFPLPACYVLAAAPALLAPALLLALPKRQHDSRKPAGAAHDQGMDDTTTHQEYWDGRYSEHHHLWSGDPNAVLVEEVTGLEPGTALDLGCGEGADAIWLARRGWRVTAADISGVALERAARHAAEAGVADRVDWQRHDLAVSFPEGTYDLVSAQFLHSPADMPREEILRSAAAAVAPGGVLLIVGHAGPPPWDSDAHGGVHLPTPEEVRLSLRLPDGGWEVLRSGEHERVQTAPDGRTMTRTDNALKLRRRTG